MTNIHNTETTNKQKTTTMDNIDVSQKKIISNAENESISHHLRTRINRTEELMYDNIDISDKVLDLGPDNLMSRKLQALGYDIEQTGYIDLDDNYEELYKFDKDTCTAFEILEHLRNPYMVLKSIRADKLVITVPLSVWFSKAYWNEEDEWDTHYHEFEPKQLRSLLSKTGWDIKHEEFWWWDKAPLKPRPLLRKYGPWPSWMAVVAHRK